MSQEYHEDIVANKDDKWKSERNIGDGQDQHSNESEVEMDLACATSRHQCKNSPDMDTGWKKKKLGRQKDTQRIAVEREGTQCNNWD